MKYIIATIIGACILFLFALFAGAVGWQHGGGAIVQVALWTIIVTVWSIIVKNWDSFFKDKQKGELSALNENAKFSILAGLILIVGMGLFFALSSNRYKQEDAITGAEFVSRIRSLNPEFYQYSDEALTWAVMKDRSDKIRIIRIDGKPWKENGRWVKWDE